MQIEWMHADNTETIAHVSKLELGGFRTTSPQHTITNKDAEALHSLRMTSAIPQENIAVAGESLGYPTLLNVGRDAETTDNLLNRLRARVIPGRINFVYPRIPSTLNINGTISPVKTIDDLQASALAGVQLDSGASAVIPPLPNGLSQYEIFERVLERTANEIQTFRQERELIGFIPKTDALDIIPLMIRDYVKKDVRVFALDFSGSTMPRSLIRTTVRAIRESLKIKRLNEPQEKHYYLHAFNVPTSVKSVNAVAPITDILTHAYGVDSMSGVMWGGGKLDREKLRYYDIDNYGAHRLSSGINVPFEVPASPVAAYVRLRAHRIADYSRECRSKLVERIAEEKSSAGYAAYLQAKEHPRKEVRNILSDVREIKAI